MTLAQMGFEAIKSNPVILSLARRVHAESKTGTAESAAALLDRLVQENGGGDAAKVAISGAVVALDLWPEKFEVRHG